MFLNNMHATRLALLYLCSSGIVALHVPYGYQSGPDIANSFAGGMVYDEEEGLLYVTGATYGSYFTGFTMGDSYMREEPVSSDCFLSVFKFSADKNEKAEMLYTERWGNANVLEACSSLALRENTAYVVGHTEEDGYMLRLKDDIEDAKDATVYGTVTHFDISINRDSGDSSVRDVTTYLNGGRLVAPTKGVHYPVATATDDSNNVFVATMTSTNDSPRVYQEERALDDRIDLTTGGQFKYGSGFKLSLERLIPVAEFSDNVGLTETLEPQWTLQAGAADGEDVFVSSMVYINSEVLLFAGSTKGFGPEFGGNARSLGDFDGFVTKVNPNTGKVPVDADQFDPTYSTRIQSLPYQDDFVNGLCHYGNDVYVVGTTYGRVETEFPDIASPGSIAFLIKLRLETLDVEWKKEIGGIPESSHSGPAQVRGIGCAVTPDGKEVYLAGTVYSGASLDIAGVTSYGGDDIFCVQVDSDSGKVNNARQIGTYHDEWLAHGGGVSVDEQGHAILLGNTRGGLMREKSEEIVDVFFLSVSRESGEHSEIVAPTEVQSANEDDGVSDGVIIISVVGSVALLFGFLIFLESAKRSRRQKESNNGDVFLEEVEEIGVQTKSIV